MLWRNKLVAGWIVACSVAGLGGQVGAADPATPAARPDWTQWRGPQRDGLLSGVAPWPDRLAGDALEQVWRVPLGPSYSGPIARGDAIYVTETKDRKTEVVKALDRSTGKVVWETAWEGALSVPFFAKSNGDWIRSTPALDGDTLYVAGMRDVLVALDTQTGKTRWTYDFVQQHKSPLPAFGFVCSPLIDGDFVYVQAGSAFCKLDKRTGKLIYRTLQDDGGMMGSAFSSPRFAELGGQRQILVQTREKLAGIDPEQGAVLWEQAVPAFRGMNILTPTVFGDTVFTSTYGGKSFSYKIQKADGKFAVEETWTNKATGYMSSPVVIDGHVYLHLQNQRFTCIDLRSGETRWTTQPYGKYWSMVANGNRILALDERGELLLIAANPQKFELLDQRKVSDDPTWAHLAVCGDELLVRELNAMTVYRWRAAQKVAQNP